MHILQTEKNGSPPKKKKKKRKGKCWRERRKLNSFMHSNTSSLPLTLCRLISAALESASTSPASSLRSSPVDGLLTAGKKRFNCQAGSIFWFLIHRLDSDSVQAAAAVCDTDVKRWTVSMQSFVSEMLISLSAPPTQRKHPFGWQIQPQS